MTTSTETRTSGLGFFSILTLIFIGLQLYGAIDWSWWHILAPLYLPLAIFGVIAGIAVACTKEKYYGIIGGALLTVSAIPIIGFVTAFF